MPKNRNLEKLISNVFTQKNKCFDKSEKIYYNICEGLENEVFRCKCAICDPAAVS